MGKNGVLTIFDGDKTVCTLTGNVCDSKDKDCIDGLVITENGTLLIGGATAKASDKPTVPLSPWPFSQAFGFKSVAKAGRWK